METLHLHRKTGSSYPTWLWYPADHESQLIALMHFSGGSCAISDTCLQDVIYVAGLHGWQVSTTDADALASESQRIAAGLADEKPDGQAENAQEKPTP